MPRNQNTRTNKSPASDSHDADSQENDCIRSQELELHRKRARDRKSQQAMRDRQRQTIAELTEQVAALSRVIEDNASQRCLADWRISELQAENANLRTLNAALQLNMLSGVSHHEKLPASPASSAVQEPEQPWQKLPLNIAPDCILDKLVLGVVFARRRLEEVKGGDGSTGPGHTYPFTEPKVRALLSKDTPTDCELSNLVGDVVRSCLEIDTLPRQVAVFYTVVLWLQWLVSPDPERWEALPEWLRPLPCQLTTPHPGWMDRVPWPAAREFLIARPDITVDQFVASYSVGFHIDWPYDPSHIILGLDQEAYINPVFTEHIRQLKNWHIRESFRRRWPDMCQLIDSDSRCTDAQVGPATESS